MTHGVGWGARNYHEGNTAGDTTDYGDYCVLVLNFLSKKTVIKAGSKQALDMEQFARHWRGVMEREWRDWMCTMTKTTLANLRKGVKPQSAGGMSNAMAVRFPALLALHDEEDVLVKSAGVTTALTHHNKETLQTSEFFARVAFRVVHGGMS